MVSTVDASDGPVLVTVEYLLANEENRELFFSKLDWLRRERLRDGAFTWGIFEDTAQRGRFLETFKVDSWEEHLRQHERVTHADDAVQQEHSRTCVGRADRHALYRTKLACYAATSAGKWSGRRN